MIVLWMMRHFIRTAALLAATIGVAACEERLNPTIVRTPVPPITAPTGEYTLRAVDGVPLPHDTKQSGTTYSLVSGTFALGTDSSWIYSSVEVVSAANGDVIGTSPANYQGTWRIPDTTITLTPARGWVRVKGDTLFWRGGPRHTWEDSLTFTLVRK